MSTVKEVAKMYDAVLSLRALHTNVKLDIRVPCRMVLLLAMAVEQGLSVTDPGNLLKKIISEEDQGKLLELTAEMLKKAEVEDFHQKLKEMAAG
ncbi:hypothetical protein Q4E93_13160 [Flavitalea sp. BT771]|uniref:hypothetical protein n=1 Tax=Flavitalea sp. BT771 TaxID=3063329 RepID=UPI0026E4114F|nr:hypothetical protein [Flavitalea sp. BT771]MDO6431547.1 hypothetical protein [Flavitalea sp. BT771]MDV6220455.1 hypothetical protein [Flavitalea sp. BT771]